jgi:DNA-binding NarL/FixJ family response regulator
MRRAVYSSSGSRPDFVICPFCEGGELVRGDPTIPARCTACGYTVDGALLEALRQIIALADAPGGYACDDCGHPQMRRLPADDEGHRCPACGPGVPAALTRREEEIALLIARGLTNRQLSAELVISELTVASHIRKILKKLGLRLRAQIAERQPGRKD